MLRLFAPGRLGRRLFLGILLLSVVAGLAADVVIWQALPDEGKAAPRRAASNTDVSPYGANFFLMQEVEEWKIRKTLQMAREAGIVWAKQQFPWEEIQPREPVAGEDLERTYVWEKSDKLIGLFEEYGFKVIARLDRPPEWARATGAAATGPLRDLDDYGDFVRAFVSRYAGRVGHIQVWNEPNLWYEWGNRKPSPDEYVALLKTAYERARAANASVYVLSAPLALTMERSERAIPETEFLEGLYKAGGGAYFDILSANAFGFGWPPDDPVNAEKLNYARVSLQRDVMVRHGDAAKAVWFNEFGWNASPEGYSNDWYIWQRVSETNQAQYTVDAMRRARSEWPWVGVLNLWYFRQVGTITPDRSEYYFRMVDVDFTPRLVYHAVKEAAAGEGVTGAGYFEESNPALSVRSGWQVVRDERASGGAYLTPQAVDATLSLAFRGQFLDLIVTRGSVQGKLAVTIDGRQANALPLDSTGRSTIDLSAGSSQWQERVPVAANLLQGAHTAQITLIAEGATPTPLPYPVKTRTVPLPGAAGVDAFVVSGGGRDVTPYWVAAAALMLTGLLVAAALLGDLRRGRAA